MIALLLISQLQVSLPSIETKSATVPGSLAEVLIGAGLLESLNRFKLAPVNSRGELDAAVFAKVATAVRDDRRYAVAYDRSGPRFALIRIPVPVDAANDAKGKPGGGRQRLRRLGEAIRAYGLHPVKRDKYGNAREWSGRGAKAYYLPAHDELRVLYYR